MYTNSRKDRFLLSIATTILALCLPLIAWADDVPDGATPAAWGGPLSATPPDSPRGAAIIDTWSQMALVDWEDNRVDAARIVLAKMTKNVDIEAINLYLLAAEPGEWGSSYEPIRTGDYDFAMITLATILYQFDNVPERLYPLTCYYLVHELLNADGGTPSLTVPGTGGLVPETENHILMTETSRYLKNQWLHNYGDAAEQANPLYDNATNGLEAWFNDYLNSLHFSGFYEYNSIPYLEYSVQALMTLEAFAESTSSLLQIKARYLLDQINLYYAVGSLDLKRCAPFNRRREYATERNLIGDPHSALEFVWSDDNSNPGAPAPWRSSASLMAALLYYRLPDDVWDWRLSKPTDYFGRIGRGSSRAPEIYSGGPDYLLSAGGVTRGTEQVARPNTLLLRDGIYDLEYCFHVPDRSGNDTTWNNTGVIYRFACGKSVVHNPGIYAPVAMYGSNWKVYQPYGAANPNFYVMTYSEDRPWPYADTGCIIVFPNYTGGAANLLVTVWYYNQSTTTMRTQFTNPIEGLVIKYDISAPKGTWVIKNAGSRDYNAWPKLDTALGMDFSRD